MTSPTGSTSSNNAGASGNRGICSLSYQGKTLRFRTNPNSISWKYQLNTKVDDTYGGRVIQLLGTKLGDLEVTAECGWGGWAYMVKVAQFFRDLMNDQRSGKPAVFEYTTRNWKLNVFAASIPFQDQVTATSRDFTMNFKVQEDISGVMSQNALSTELSRLNDGIGWSKTAYNTSNPADFSSAEQGYLSPLNNPTVAGVVNQVQNANPLSGLLGGGIIPGIG